MADILFLFLILSHCNLKTKFKQTKSKYIFLFEIYYAFVSDHSMFSRNFFNNWSLLRIIEWDGIQLEFLGYSIPLKSTDLEDKNLEIFR